MTKEDKLFDERAEYGRLPGGLVEGWDGLVFWYKTNLSFRDEEDPAKKHEELVNMIISQQITDSFDNWQEWRLVKAGSVIWKDLRQVSLAKFRIKDSY